MSTREKALRSQKDFKWMSPKVTNEEVENRMNEEIETKKGN